MLKTNQPNNPLPEVFLVDFLEIRKKKICFLPSCFIVVMLGIKPLCVLGVFPTLSSTPAQIDGLCVSVYLHSDKRCMTTVLYLFLFLLRLIKPLTLSKATAVSKSQQLSRRDPMLSGGPCEGRIRTKGGSKSVQCPVHSRVPLPPGGRSMQVFPESWALCLA